jgi:uncharacterized protein (DUF433 family)
MASGQPRRKDIYGGRDPLLLAAYPIVEAAHYLKMPVATLRAWAMGQRYTVGAERRMTGRIIALPKPSEPILSFVNLIEAHVLRALRTEHSFSMQAVKAALKELQKHSSGPHPLAYEDLFAGAGDLFLEKYGDLISLTKSGQIALRAALQAFLKRIERGPGFVPLRLYPFIRSLEYEGPKTVTVDPRVAFGRPVITGTRIPTAEVRSRIDAGESLEEVAEDFGQEKSKIEDAVIYERGLAA